MHKMTPINQRRDIRGFSLIELVVAMLIAAILVAVAVPGYNSYVRKARRTDAKTAVMDLASLEERFYSTQNKYSVTGSDLGYAGFPASVGTYYTINVTTLTSLIPTATSVGTYTITATAVGDQVKDLQCQTLSVTQAGVQSATDSTGTSSAAITQTCWH
jgi:type IV pilus assembly protein PilE